MTLGAIAQRMFNVDGQDVVCRFFSPEEDDGSYFCHYEIEWPEGVRSKRAGGVDGVQAVILAMQMAHTDFLVARNIDGRKIAWLNEQSLGLPIASIIRDWDRDNSF
ncbi:MAG: hypothetical protein JWL66_2826 [Sphingomonadales bacterium]|nr:hypothetical protein [Sphingomonadales bacterium]